MPTRRRVHGVFLPLAALVLLLAGCGDAGEPPAPAGDPAEAVRADVREIHRATVSGDMETVIRYTHPCVIEMIGGEEKMREILEGTVAEMMKAVEFREFDFRGDPEFLAGEAHEFVLVPVRSVYGMMGQTVESKSFQLGVRKVGSADWRYIESPKLPMILENFPDFPEDHPLPENTMELR